MDDVKIGCCMNATDEMDVKFDDDKVFLVLNSSTNDIALNSETAQQLLEALIDWVNRQ